jgi:hypothetical protein
VNRLSFGEGLGATNFSQGFARDIVHDNKGQSRFHKKVAHPNNMGMLKHRQTAGFCHKALLQLLKVLGTEGIRLEAGIQGFNHHYLVEQGMGSAIGSAKATLPQNGIELIFTALEDIPNI